MRHVINTSCIWRVANRSVEALLFHVHVLTAALFDHNCLSPIFADFGGRLPNPITNDVHEAVYMAIHKVRLIKGKVSTGCTLPLDNRPLTALIACYTSQGSVWKTRKPLYTMVVCTQNCKKNILCCRVLFGKKKESVSHATPAKIHGFLINAPWRILGSASI